MHPIVNEPIIKVEEAEAKIGTETVNIDISQSAEKSNNDRCTNGFCKRKQKDGCVNAMCFACCLKQSDALCSGHLVDKRKRDEEEQYIDQMLHGARTKKQFKHFEDKFSKYGDTVIIWCLKDFVQIKKFSEDVFAAYEKDNRKRMLMMKRHYQSHEIDKSMILNYDCNSFTKMKDKISVSTFRNEKYEKLKSKWSETIVKLN